jgi:hypothetical protein
LVDAKNSENQYHLQTEESVFKFVKFVNKDGWGLVEFDYNPSKPNEKLRIRLHNNLVTGGNLTIDDVLIRQINNDVFYKTEKFVFKNNRYIIR